MALNVYLRVEMMQVFFCLPTMMRGGLEHLAKAALEFWSTLMNISGLSVSPSRRDIKLNDGEKQSIG